MYQVSIRDRSWPGTTTLFFCATEKRPQGATIKIPTQYSIAAEANSPTSWNEERTEQLGLNMPQPACSLRDSQARQSSQRGSSLNIGRSSILVGHRLWWDLVRSSSQTRHLGSARTECLQNGQGWWCQGGSFWGGISSYGLCGAHIPESHGGSK